MVQINLLESKLVEKGISRYSMAQELGINYRTFDNKLHGVTEFKASEIAAIKKKLDLNSVAVDNIFFAEDFTKNENIARN